MSSLTVEFIRPSGKKGVRFQREFLNCPDKIVEVRTITIVRMSRELHWNL